MTSYRFTNNALTTLGSSISPTDTTITVASGTGAEFPALTAGQSFTATLSSSATGIPNEIVSVTARVGDTMTVVRAQEGTTAQAWSVGARFSNFVSAGFLNQLADGITIQTQPGNYAVDSGAANAGVVTLVPAPGSLAALIGVPVRVKKQGAVNTGAYTLNVNALGAKAVLIGGTALEGGELVANEIYEAIYDGTQFNLISNPGTIHGDRLAANSVVNAALAQMTTSTIKGNLGGGTATPYDVPLSALMTALNILSNYANPGSVTIGQTVICYGQNNVYYGAQHAIFPFDAPLTNVAMGGGGPIVSGDITGDDNTAFARESLTDSSIGFQWSSGIGALTSIWWFAIGSRL